MASHLSATPLPITAVGTAAGSIRMRSASSTRGQPCPRRSGWDHSHDRSGTKVGIARERRADCLALHWERSKAKGRRPVSNGCYRVLVKNQVSNQTLAHCAATWCDRRVNSNRPFRPSESLRIPQGIDIAPGWATGVQSADRQGQEPASTCGGSPMGDAVGISDKDSDRDEFAQTGISRAGRRPTRGLHKSRTSCATQRDGAPR